MVPLTSQDITIIHDRLIKDFGGSLGLREPKLLQAIVDKPLASFGGMDLYPTIFDKAAALYEAICNYHVFVDGNKRTSIACLEYFLHLNGRTLMAKGDEKEAFTLEIANSHPDLAEVAAWIERHAKLN